MFKLSQIVPRSAKSCNNLRLLLAKSWASSTVAAVEAKTTQNGSFDEIEARDSTATVSQPTNITLKSSNSMVAAAFASLNTNIRNEINTPVTDEKISKASTINELFSISEGSGVSRRLALKIVSILADWTTSGKIQQADFEKDPRFLKLCKVLSKGSSVRGKVLTARSEDLSTVLGVTADDEAAKLVESLTLSQMVKVMATLALKKRRSTPLLRSLAYNITGTTEQLNLKESADLLYSMASLNFIDENLLDRVSNDLCAELEKQKVVSKSSVIGSTLTSFGLLKYKNPVVLDALVEWTIKNYNICRPQDIYSLIMTLAVVDYLPHQSDKLFNMLKPIVTSSEAGQPLVWLEIVWSLVLLNQATPEQISSVLSETFLKEVEENNSSSLSTKLKLLNINAAASHLLSNYTGSKLPPTSRLLNTKITRPREKLEMIDSVIDSLKNLIQSEQLLKKDVKTNFGFYIDAECVLDKKCTPLPLEEENSSGIKVAILSLDYHDMTKGKEGPTGINHFAQRILEKEGYKVLVVPYTDFKPKDKLLHRVKYLQQKMKQIVQSESN